MPPGLPMRNAKPAVERLEPAMPGPVNPGSPAAKAGHNTSSPSGRKPAARRIDLAFQRMDSWVQVTAGWIEPPVLAAKPGRNWSTGSTPRKSALCHSFPISRPCPRNTARWCTLRGSRARRRRPASASMPGICVTTTSSGTSCGPKPCAECIPRWFTSPRSSDSASRLISGWTRHSPISRRSPDGPGQCSCSRRTTFTRMRN